jgi:hypothetical protein
MLSFRIPFLRHLTVLAACLLAALVGCGGDGVGTCYPVGGKVSIEGKPVRGKAGTVRLKPDVAKGNKSPFDALGSIDREGKYTVVTRGKDGAPPGWYKVVVAVVQPNSGEAFDTPVVKMDYLSEQKTPLTFEVVANPATGAYDLNLKKK